MPVFGQAEPEKGHLREGLLKLLGFLLAQLVFDERLGLFIRGFLPGLLGQALVPEEQIPAHAGHGEANPAPNRKL